MKVLVTESQLHKILKEDLGKNDPQLNAILDKALAQGFESLTDQEREMLNQMSQNKSGAEIQADAEPSDYPGEKDINPEDDMTSPDYEGGGEDVMDSDLPRELDNEQYIMFKHLFPREALNFNLDGTQWDLQFKDVDGVERLSMNPRGSDDFIYMTPFWNSQKILVNSSQSDITNSLSIDPTRIPESEDDMHRFIGEFIRMVPAIIKRLTT